MDTALFVPSLDRKLLDTASPAADLGRNVLATPSNVDTGGVLEQLRGRRPLVRLELPGLTGGENRHESVPIVRTEVGRAVD